MVLFERERFPREHVGESMLPFCYPLIKLFYNPHAVTSAEVGAEGEVHRARQSAMAAGHFMLSGGFFEEHERFNKLFDLMEDPRSFHRHARMVIERPDLNGTSCHTSWEVAFGDLANGEGSAGPVDAAVGGQ